PYLRREGVLCSALEPRRVQCERALPRSHHGALAQGAAVRRRELGSKQRGAGKSFQGSVRRRSRSLQSSVRQRDGSPSHSTTDVSIWRLEIDQYLRSSLAFAVAGTT